MLIDRQRHMMDTQVVGGGQCPIVDTWWQTETGAIAIAPLPVKGWGQKPGSASLPFLGMAPVLLDMSGALRETTDSHPQLLTIFCTYVNCINPSPTGKEIEGPAEGLLALKNPWPSAIRSIHGNHTRMEETYFSFPGRVSSCRSIIV